PVMLLLFATASPCAGKAPPDDGRHSSEKGGKMSSPTLANKDAVDKARAAVAKHLQAPPARVEVQALDGPAVPGLVVFRAKARDEEGAVDGYAAGVVGAGGEVVLDEAAAATQAMRAWGYGGKRTVP